MGLKNNSERYGWLSIALHWLMALAVFGLFGLGYWMVDGKFKFYLQLLNLFDIN